MLLPGVGFIVGVNFADKNVREIVFRNTPAELGYVLVVSLFVHLFFAVISFEAGFLEKFNTAYLYAQYSGYDKSTAAVPLHDALRFLIISLSYYLLATLAGFVPGVLLGLFVRQPRTGLGDRLRSVLIKHRFMAQLVGRNQGQQIYASVLLKDTFAHFEPDPSGSKNPGVENDNANPAAAKFEKIDYRVVIQGTLRDSYFASDGTLLYIVFDTYSIVRADGSQTVALEGIVPPYSSNDNQLVIEGRNIALVSYSRTEVPAALIEDALKNLN